MSLRCYGDKNDVQHKPRNKIIHHAMCRLFIGDMLSHMYIYMYCIRCHNLDVVQTYTRNLRTYFYLVSVFDYTHMRGKKLLIPRAQTKLPFVYDIISMQPHIRMLP